ncbi:RNA exonuclease 3 like protein [Verticillium longisporum]|uniref:RNA exonuclease 3 like protein n=1 Tax=Verticillium longisporum TaxID=100787 RepID=A0A8I2ZWT0_VERLO|nr:RNA exonuclease 3 like protein [Verticillium longisporum]
MPKQNTGSRKGSAQSKDLGPHAVQIEPDAEYMLYLTRLTSSSPELKKEGYIIKQLSINDLEAKNRCQRCDSRCVCKKPIAATVSVAQNVADTLPNVRVFDAAVSGSAGSKGRSTPRKNESTRVKSCPSNTGENSAKLSTNALGKQVAQDINEHQKEHQGEGKFRCNWHSGEIKNKVWTCCNQHVSQPGCMHDNEHLPREFSLKEMTVRFQCYNTPRAHEYFRSPKLIRSAVALDCEMGTAFDNEPQLVRVTLIDYFTAEVLVNHLVWPDVNMAHLNTQYSGVTWPQLKQAQRDGLCIMGTGIARLQILKYIGPQTIVVVHGGNSDLSALNWIHPVIVDSYLVEAAYQKAKREQEEADRESAEAERQWLEGGPGPSADAGKVDEKKEKKQQSSQRGKLSLKSLAQERLGRQIQMGRGHDSLEDAMAARDLVHWHVLRLIKQAEEDAAGVV